MAAMEQQEIGFSHENTGSKVPERLVKRHQTRLEDAEKRRETKDHHRVEEEKTEFFTLEFNRERAVVEGLLSACCPGADRAGAADTLERATAHTVRLQKYLNDSTHLLTQYDLKQAQAAFQKLQTSLNEARHATLPKKKFAFRTRTKAKTETANLQEELPKTDTTMTDGKVMKVDVQIDENQCGFDNLSDAVVTKTAEVIERRDVLLTRLRNCRVKLCGSPSTLHLKDIEGCEILCGPVSSSVFVDGCVNSTLAFPCQQLRTHNTVDTKVYLHVTSRAIIEDCTGLSFAPFSWSYGGLEKDFEASGLDRGRNNWREVDDFNWLMAGTPSPNWSVMPEEERRTVWED